MHVFHTDAMPGAEATTTTAELDPHQAGDWSSQGSGEDIKIVEKGF